MADNERETAESAGTEFKSAAQHSPGYLRANAKAKSVETARAKYSQGEKVVFTTQDFDSMF